MAISSIIYFLMELLSDVFSGQSFLFYDLCYTLLIIMHFIYPLIVLFIPIFVMAAESIPLYETAFTRCTIITILSYFWLRKSGHSILGQTHVRKLLVSRALMGYLSLTSYVFW